MMQILFSAAGLLSLGLGILGAFLPGLPTTPFLLLAAFCFAKGSPRFHRWFCGTKLYKKHLKTLVTERQMTLKAKLSILLPATAMLAVAFILSPWWQMRAFLVFLCVSKYVYFFTCIGTVKKGPSVRLTGLFKLCHDRRVAQLKNMMYNFFRSSK